MPVNHRFLEHDFGNGFQTHNAILDTTPYEPEVLFVGTFNPNIPTNNASDFFYSRNFFWPLMENLFVHNRVYNNDRRVPRRGPLPDVITPSAETIFEICRNNKSTFADLIKSVNVQNVVGYEDKDLACLCRQELCDWSTRSIISYLLRSTSINKVYLTRQATDVWKKQWNDIKNYRYGRFIKFASIFTPSARGLKGSPQHKVLLCHWLFNSNFPAYGQLSHEWLASNDVNIEKFRKDCECLE